MKTRYNAIVLLALCMGLGCGYQQDIGDAAKPPPPGTAAPGAPASGGAAPSSAPSGAPNPGTMETPK